MALEKVRPDSSYVGKFAGAARDTPAPVKTTMRLALEKASWARSIFIASQEKSGARDRVTRK
jgi:hypothetical protein